MDEDATAYFLCEGTVRVSGGELSTKYVDQDSLRGADGTTFFGFVRDRPLGLTLIFK